jgi:hypothetical protein
MALVIRVESDAVVVGRWRGADFELVQYDALALNTREARGSQDAPATAFEHTAITTTASTA